MNRTIARFLLFSLLVFVWLPGLAAQTLPKCDARPGWQLYPRVNSRYFCMEVVIADNTAGEFGFTDLAFAPDGRLFAARPVQGEVLLLTDQDDDGLPETPEVIASGLTLPNALVYTGGALYIAGGAHIYRLTDDGALTTLVDNLPTGTGRWTGGLAIHDDALYVGTGAPCDSCLWDDPWRGTVVRYALDGTQQEVIARGFYYPAALLWLDAGLLIGDTSPQSAGMAVPLDEINRWTPDQMGAHFGYPDCIGGANTATHLRAFDCSDVVPPLLTVGTRSAPHDFALYQGAAFPHLQGQLLVILAGSFQSPVPRGYTLIGLDSTLLDTMDTIEGQPYTPIIPNDPLVMDFGIIRYNRSAGLFDNLSAYINERGAGVYPHRLYSVAISPEGWIYFSMGGGTIGVLRPQ